MAVVVSPVIDSESWQEDEYSFDQSSYGTDNKSKKVIYEEDKTVNKR